MEIRESTTRGKRQEVHTAGVWRARQMVARAEVERARTLAAAVIEVPSPGPDLRGRLHRHDRTSPLQRVRGERIGLRACVNAWQPQVFGAGCPSEHEWRANQLKHNLLGNAIATELL